jgi:hypothetical protein
VSATARKRKRKKGRWAAAEEFGPEGKAGRGGSWVGVKRERGEVRAFLVFSFKPFQI